MRSTATSGGEGRGAGRCVGSGPALWSLPGDLDQEGEGYEIADVDRPAGGSP